MKRLFTLVSLIILLLLFATKSKAVVVPSFFDTTNSISLVGDAQNSQLQKLTYWGAPCTNAKYRAFTFDGWGNGATEDFEECLHITNYGEMSTHGVKLAGTDIAYPIRSLTNSPLNAYPIPGSNDLLFFENTWSSTGDFYTYIYKDFPNNFTTERSLVTGKPIYYKLTKAVFTAQSITKLPDGTLSRLINGSIGYSANGKFIAGNSGSYQTLINTETGAGRIFGQSTVSNEGGTPTGQVALSSDAALALVTDSRSGNYKIYNLKNCIQSSTPSAPELCEKRDISEQLRAEISNFSALTQARFISRDIIEAYVLVNSPTGLQKKKYHILAPGVQLQNFEYLGLGDSFASGEGVFNYKLNTDVSDNGCHLSLNAYTYLIKNSLGYNTAESVACSGAKIKDVVGISSEYVDDDPQASGMSEGTYDEQIFSNFLVGYRRQKDYINRKLPTATTISIGGNDINFGKKIAWCVTAPNNCYDSPQKHTEILKEIKAQFQRLTDTYTALMSASPSLKLYVIGYPNIAKTNSNCAVNVRLSNEEIKLSEDIISDLNSIIKSAAQKADAYYVDTSEAFAGHKLCETDSWNVAVNGLTAGNDALYLIGYPIGKESYHPNKLGHELFKNTILQKTNNLTAAMPTSDSSVSVSAMSSKLVPILDGNLQNVPTPFLNDSISTDVVKKGTSISSNINNTNTFLQENSLFNVELHSDPVVIGSAVATGNKELSVTATIPTDTTPGLHTIHIYGNNIAGEAVDIYKDITVIASDTDYDGDGILNTEDKCNFVLPANTDTDKDGVDDACDALIEKPPIVIPPEPPVTPPVVAPITPKQKTLLILRTILKIPLRYLKKLETSYNCAKVLRLILLLRQVR